MSALLVLLIAAILTGALSFVDSALGSLVPISLNAEKYMTTLLGTDSFEALFGDPDGDPLTLVTSFIKAIAIAVAFKYIYSWFADIVTEVLTGVPYHHM